ncbi:MAG TPA: SCP2 sterol-binding domain-containing protein [Solirubrobacterales bacterium]|nr:SCP2 sterol-binding domain-containing protein [Solirubrobacterales bacterium]
MAPVPDLQLEEMEPAAVFAAIARMSEDEFTTLMDDPTQRPVVISSLVQHMASLFRPEKAGDTDATIHIKLWDKPGGGYDHVEMRIADGACTIHEEPEREADLTLKVRPTDLRKLVTGESGARRLAFRGRLRVLGDIGLAMKLPDLFDFTSTS